MQYHSSIYHIDNNVQCENVKKKGQKMTRSIYILDRTRIYRSSSSSGSPKIVCSIAPPDFLPSMYM
jgi:hypothetical protein